MREACTNIRQGDRSSEKRDSDGVLLVSGGVNRGRSAAMTQFFFGRGGERRTALWDFFVRSARTKRGEETALGRVADWGGAFCETNTMKAETAVEQVDAIAWRLLSCLARSGVLRNIVSGVAKSAEIEWREHTGRWLQSGDETIGQEGAGGGKAQVVVRRGMRSTGEAAASEVIEGLIGKRQKPIVVKRRRQGRREERIVSGARRKR
ncbi:hypothetical protein ERJ75_001138400 [Trypanosoma vivax]|nr:hypothetical protein ERJ75_001138400 [Trypanosoma vivax]